MRLIKFVCEFPQQLAVGWAFISAVRNTWNRSHPKAVQNRKDWIDRICQ